MKDYNFFSPYIVVKKSSKKRTFYSVLMTFLISAALVGLVSWNHYKIVNLENDAQSKLTIIESSDSKEKVKEFQLMTERVKFLTNYNNILENVSRSLDASAIITSDYLMELSDTFPEGTFVNTLALSQDAIRLQGIAKSRIAVAELQHNLKELDNISDVQINSITSENLEGETYVFSISCRLGALKQDEIKQ